MAENEFTQIQIAAALDLTPRRIRDLEAEGMPFRRRGNRKYYPLPQAINWYIDYKRREIAGQIADSDPKKAQLRKMMAEARMAELELAEREGQLITVDAHRETLFGLLDPIRARILNLPGAVAPRLVGLDHAREAVAVLQPAVGILLSELTEHLSIGTDLDDETPSLPFDIPGRSHLIAAGLDSLEAVTRHPDLTELRGIGAVTANGIAAYCDRGAQ